MSDGRLDCPKCGGAMQSGFLYDRVSWFDDGKRLLWVEEDGSETRRAKPDGGLEVDAYRCPACSYVELWAGHAGEHS